MCRYKPKKQKSKNTHTHTHTHTHTQKYFSLPDHELAEKLILVFNSFYEKKKRIKANSNLIYRNYKLLVKSLLHSVFSQSFETYNRKLAERPRQILASYEHIRWRTFELV